MSFEWGRGAYQSRIDAAQGGRYIQLPACPVRPGEVRVTEGRPGARAQCVDVRVRRVVGAAEAGGCAECDGRVAVALVQFCEAG